jgi:uncharacterized membrane protein YeiB
MLIGAAAWRAGLFRMGSRASRYLPLVATIGIGVFILQVVFSAYWLKRYLYGPVEWLWRSTMYGARQPLWRT